MFAALQMRYEQTLLKDLTRKKQDLTTAETRWSKERAASKVTPRVFTTLENGMEASPTKRLLTGTLSLLRGGLQRSTSVFCSLSFKLFFIIHLLISWQRDSTFPIALKSDSRSISTHEQSSESLAKKCNRPVLLSKVKMYTHALQDKLWASLWLNKDSALYKISNCVTICFKMQKCYSPLLKTTYIQGKTSQCSKLDLGECLLQTGYSYTQGKIPLTYRCIHTGKTHTHIYAKRWIFYI